MHKKRAPSRAEPVPLAPPTPPPPGEKGSTPPGATETQGLLGRGQAGFDLPTRDALAAGESSPLPVPGATKSYFTDILWTFLFPTDPGHLGVFFLIWVVLIVEACLQVIPFLGWAAAVLIEGWFAAICLNVVGSAANGEEDLTIGDYAGDFFGEVVVPISKFLAATAVAVLPAYYFLAFLISRVTLGPGMTQWDYILGAALYGNYGSLLDLVGDDPLFFLLPVLAFAGLFLWPMLLLVVAIGGFAGLGRIDLMAITVARTFPAYLCTVLIVLVSVAMTVGLVILAASSSTPGSSSFMLIVALGAGLRAYAQIVAMRVIGLYYYHCKGRFAWSWG